MPQRRSYGYLDGVGAEWGTDWVIKHILQEELTSVDIDETFEESVRQCYPEEVTVGWITVDTVEVLKSQDPTSWRIARDEYIDELVAIEEIYCMTMALLFIGYNKLKTSCRRKSSI